MIVTLLTINIVPSWIADFEIFCHPLVDIAGDQFICCAAGPTLGQTLLHAFVEICTI